MSIGQAATTSATRIAYYSWAREIYGAASKITGKIERAAGVAVIIQLLLLILSIVAILLI